MAGKSKAQATVDDAILEGIIESGTPPYHNADCIKMAATVRDVLFADPATRSAIAEYLNEMRMDQPEERLS